MDKKHEQTNNSGREIIANQVRCLEKAKKREIIVDKNGVLY